MTLSKKFVENFVLIYYVKKFNMILIICPNKIIAYYTKDLYVGQDKSPKILYGLIFI